MAFRKVQKKTSAATAESTQTSPRTSTPHRSATPVTRSATPASRSSTPVRSEKATASGRQGRSDSPGRRSSTPACTVVPPRDDAEGKETTIQQPAISPAHESRPQGTPMPQETVNINVSTSELFGEGVNTPLDLSMSASSSNLTE